MSERPAWAALATVTAVALAVRVAGAALRPPWHDEYFTAFLAGLPWRALLEALRSDSGPPLSYALVKLLALAGAPPLAAARALAAGAGTLAAGLAALAAGRAFGGRAGIWCGLLVALHPLALAWSCEGRAYALLLLAGAWGWERLELRAAGGDARAGLAAAVALGCWSHAFGLVLAGALAAAALTLPHPRRRGALLAVAAGVVSNLPWLPVAMAQPRAATAWMSAAWDALPALERGLAPVRLLPPAAPFGATLDIPSAPLALQVVAAALALLLLARIPLPPRPALLLGVPAVGLAALALLGVPAFYPGRAEALFLVPFLALLAGGEAGAAWRRAALGLLALTAAVGSAMTLAAWGAAPPGSERRLAEAVAGRLPQGGTVVVGGYWRLPLAFHLARGPGRFELSSFPAEAASHPGWYEPAVDRPAPGELQGLLDALRPHAGRTAVVVAPGLPTEAGLRRLAAELGLHPALLVPGGEFFLPARSAGE